MTIVTHVTLKEGTEPWHEVIENVGCSAAPAAIAA